jgi:signal transduction histidine kinase
MTMTAATVGPQQYGKIYESCISSVRQARHDVGLVLSTWGLQELTPDAKQILSELMANAIEHTESNKIGTSITRTGERSVRLEVTDRSSRKPQLQAVGSDDESGRGIALVAALSSNWGWERIFGGKKVWAEMTA